MTSYVGSAFGLVRDVVGAQEIVELARKEATTALERPRVLSKYI